MFRVAAVVVLLVLALAGGGALAVSLGYVDWNDDDENDSTGTPEPTATPDSTATPTSDSTTTQEPTPTPEPSPDPTPTPEPTPEYEASSPSVVTVYAYKHNESQELNSGNLTIYDDDGSVVDQADFDRIPRHSATELEPGENYTAHISEVGRGDRWPDVAETFDPGEVDDLEIVTADIEFQGTDTYRYQQRIVYGEYVEDGEITANQSELVEDLGVSHTEGFTESGNFSHDQNLLSDTHSPVVKINDEVYSQFRWLLDKPWIDMSSIELHPEHRPEHIPTRESLDEFESRHERTYLRTKELNDSDVPKQLRYDSIPESVNGTEVHVFEITFDGHSEYAEEEMEPYQDGTPQYDFEDSNARVYVDSETGHVLKWYSEQRFGMGMWNTYPNPGMVDNIVVIHFYDHNEEGLDVDPDEYPPFAEDD